MNVHIYISGLYWISFPSGRMNTVEFPRMMTVSFKGTYFYLSKYLFYFMSHLLLNIITMTLRFQQEVFMWATPHKFPQTSSKYMQQAQISSSPFPFLILLTFTHHKLYLARLPASNFENQTSFFLRKHKLSKCTANNLIRCLS